MLALLFILGALCPLHFAELQINLLDPTSNNVLMNIFPNSFLLSQPNCTTYKNKTAQLLYTDLSNSETKTKDFPVCPDNQNWLLLSGLKNENTYNMSYVIESDASNNLTAKTASVLNYQQINDGLQARSGAMVVITVILTLAMVTLLVGLILTFFFFSG